MTSDSQGADHQGINVQEQGRIAGLFYFIYKTHTVSSKLLHTQNYCFFGASKSLFSVKAVHVVISGFSIKVKQLSYKMKV